MEYLIFISLGVAAMAVAFTMAINRNPARSLLGQASLLLMILGVGAAMAYCVYYPGTTGADDGIITLAIFPLFIVGLIPWALLKTARNINKDRRKPPAEKEPFIIGDIDAMKAEFDAKMELQANEASNKKPV